MSHEVQPISEQSQLPAQSLPQSPLQPQPPEPQLQPPAPQLHAPGPQPQLPSQPPQPQSPPSEHVAQPGPLFALQLTGPQ
jgi:hypothetical protein